MDRYPQIKAYKQRKEAYTVKQLVKDLAVGVVVALPILAEIYKELAR